MSVDVRAKLAEKGLTLPVSSKPIAAYVPATRTGNLVFTAGQLPMVDGKIAQEGKVGAEVSVDEAKALIDLGSRFGKKTDEGLYVHHDLTQEELAQLVGASRETVNKALADFAGRGWLRLDGRAVLITDLDRLEKRGK